MKNYRYYLSFIWRAAAWLLIFPILFYQKLISPYTPSSCRFTPSCSEYTRQALLMHGPIKGLALGASCVVILGEGADMIPYHTTSIFRNGERAFKENLSLRLQTLAS